MSSYFEEHDCEPLSEGQTPNLFLQMARLLIDSGINNEEWFLHFDQMSGSQRKPPAAKHFIQSLPKVNNFKAEEKCCVCLKELVTNETVMLPCEHKFHSQCIIPWLNITNSCPLCRTEFPTDDENYEQFKKEKHRKESLLNELHNSMFG